MDGTVIETAHLEDVVLVPDRARNLETESLELLPGDQGSPADAVDQRKSLGEMLEQPTGKAKAKAAPRGKLDKLSAGQYIAYSLSRPSKVCSVGRIWTITRADACLVIHSVTAPGEAGGHEVLDAGASPILEQITVQQVLLAVQLHDGVMSHAAARKLDKAGWKLDAEELHKEALVRGPMSHAPTAMEQLVQAIKSLPLVGSSRGDRAV